MEFKEIIDQVRDYSQQFDYYKLLYFSNAIAGEVGEYCNLIKKHYIHGLNRNTGDLSKIGFELADIFIYLVLNARTLELDLESFILSKLVLLSERGK